MFKFHKDKRFFVVVNVRSFLYTTMADKIQIFSTTLKPDLFLNSTAKQQKTDLILLYSPLQKTNHNKSQHSTSGQTV